MNSKIYKICYTAVLVALGLVLPQVAHIVGGATAGTIFLPMHIPVFVAGMLIGVGSGLATAVILPILSFLFMGMPSAVRLPYMIIELSIYAVVSGFLTKKNVNAVFSIVLAQIVGRVVLLGVASAMYYISSVNMGSVSVVLSGFIMGLPGIAIQLTVIPVLVISLRRIIKNGNYRISSKSY